MHDSTVQKPVWAWLVLIGGGLFAVTAFPGIFVMLLVPLFRWQELSFFSILFMTLAICILVVVIWGMKRAWQAIKAYRLIDPSSLTVLPEELMPVRKKPIWPWFVILPGAFVIISTGPGVIMLPIMPIFLAGMSTDSGDTPEYVPLLIFFGGYGIIIGYIILLIFAIRALRMK
ncbi:hypothetical protein AB1K83_08965 [Sporosarcina sp. 179-K 3D1 HS]|uniref:hypothetical protein n=1 Tax=Sporosarcina sp. 179-K 3D1 HS TaxID=3232169 RepID=UPI0039A20FB3